MDLTIRDAGRDDAEALALLLGQLGYSASTGDVAWRLDRLQASEADRLVVAEISGTVVGLASLHTSLSVAYDQPAAKLSAIIVDGHHRRRGLGEALVAELEADARRRGCGLMFLTTARQRSEAHAFYRRIGFEETGRRFAKILAR